MPLLASPLAFLLAFTSLIILLACSGSPEPPGQAATAPVPTVTVDAGRLTRLPAPGSAEPSAEVGAQLVQAYGCNACHSADGTALVGPTWLGLYGTEEELEDGSTVIVDDPYIAESIKDPNARITRGFTAGLMPATLGVKDEEIPHIIEYMKTLR